MTLFLNRSAAIRVLSLFFMKKLFFIFLLFFFLCIIFFWFFFTSVSNTSHTFLYRHRSRSLDHIIILMMENKSYADIVGNRDAPYINSLIHQYSFADHYLAVAHPSLPNYLALLGGSTFGITSDCVDCFVSSSTLVDQLEQMHKTWRAYMESMPSSCFIGDAYPYVQKHNPFIYFDRIRTDTHRCQSIVPYPQLSFDFRSPYTTPTFAWITPNVCNDMHSCSVATGDAWLAGHLPQILQSPAFTRQNSLLILTWDEEEGSGANHVPAIFIGNSVKHGFVSSLPYTHYSLLHTIETIWGLAPLTASVSQSPLIGDIFQ